MGADDDFKVERVFGDGLATESDSLSSSSPKAFPERVICQSSMPVFASFCEWLHVVHGPAFHVATDQDPQRCRVLGQLWLR